MNTCVFVEKGVIMSNVDDQSVIHAAIDVIIGNIKVIAVLDNSHSFNSVHVTVFKKICEADDGQISDDVINKTIDLNMYIDNRSVIVAFRVMPELWADMILGEEFFVSVEAHVHRDVELFKWSCEDESVTTAMVDNYDNFRAISGGSRSSSCVPNGTKSSEKKDIGNTASQEPFNSDKKKRKRNKRSKKNNDNDPGSTNSQLSGDSSASHETKSSEKHEEIEIIKSEEERKKKKRKRTKQKKLQNNSDPSTSSGSSDSQLCSGSCASNETRTPEKEEVKSAESQEEQKKKKKRRTKKKKSKNNNLSSSLVVINHFQLPPLTLDMNDSIKMFIVEQEMLDLFRGKLQIFVAIYFPQLNVNIIRGEIVDYRENKLLDLHMATLHVAFGEAKKREVSNLHVFSQNETSIMMMESQKKYKNKKGGFRNRNPRNHFIKRYAAYYDVSKFKSVKFEHVPEYDIEKHDEMVRAEKLIDQFIESHDEF